MQPQSRVRRFRLNDKPERKRNPRDRQRQRRITDPCPPGTLTIDVPEYPLDLMAEYSPAERLLWEIFTGHSL